jgi:phospholipase/carboxylesterase
MLDASHDSRPKSADIVVSRPATAAGLLLLFHGVGSSAADLLPLAEWLSGAKPDLIVVSVQAPEASGPGWQWFSVQGVTEANRPARVAGAIPAFVSRVKQWQCWAGVDAARTTLLGFSQGAIMGLAALESETQPLAARLFALSGRFARPPVRGPNGSHVHLLHGDNDPIMPVRLAEEARAQLAALGADVTLDCFPGLGHGIDARVADAILQRWKEPLG